MKIKPTDKRFLEAHISGAKRSITDLIRFLVKIRAHNGSAGAEMTKLFYNLCSADKSCEVCLSELQKVSLVSTKETTANLPGIDGH